MLKMSPALFVVWWVVRREWRAIGAAVAAAIALSVASLPWAGPSVQARFYTEVLPTFSSGDYNSLAVSIGLFGNHSVPNLLNQVWPARGGVLSPIAQALSTLVALGALAALAVWFRAPNPTPFQRAAQASAFGVLMLLVPVYTYEHHLVFALPAAVIAVLGVLRGALGRRWTALAGTFIGILLFDLQYIRAIAESLPASLVGLGGVLQELKSVALIGLFGICVRLGVRDPG
jgi:alpha-1,2-mannosyltransferase